MKPLVILFTLFFICIACTDCSSECPATKLHLHCGLPTLSAFLSSCQNDNQCGAGFKCCTIFWCIKRCTRTGATPRPAPAPAPKPTGKVCTSPNDCLANHCCVNRTKSADKGVCQKMGGSGAKCYVRDPYTFTPPPGVVQTCPCGFGNYCSGISSQVDPEFGTTGTCNSF